MKHLLHLLFLSVFIVCNTTGVKAVNLGEVRFDNEETDTTTITNILIDMEAAGIETSGQLISYAAKKFIGKPYVAGTLEGPQELLSINTSGLDCTTLVETAVALAMTVESRRTSWRDYVYTLESIRYRGGEMNGYASRLHYISDWIVDNNHRGNMTEVTDRIGRADHQIKTLDYMSQNRNLYPALKDSATFAKLKNAEIGFRSHRFPYIKTMNIKGAELREGDIVAITTSTKGLDVTHMGVVTLKNGTPHLIHASSKAGKVVEDELPLHEYVRRNRNATGIRVVRIN